jgi:hypothetical protein
MTDTETPTPADDAGDVATRTNPEPDVDPPELPVGSVEPLADVDVPEVITLAQPVPIQRDDTPGAPGEPTLVWVDGETLDPVAVGPEPPDEGGGGETPATGAIAGTPGSFTPPGATPPADLSACASLSATPSSAWTTGQHVVLGDASHASWDAAAWVGGDAP